MEKITVQLKIYTHSRTEPGLSSMEKEPQAHPHPSRASPRMLQVGADSSAFATCGKGGRGGIGGGEGREGGGRGEGCAGRAQAEEDVSAHCVSRLLAANTTSARVGPSGSRFDPRLSFAGTQVLFPPGSGVSLSGTKEGARRAYSERRQHTQASWYKSTPADSSG